MTFLGRVYVAQVGLKLDIQQVQHELVMLLPAPLWDRMTSLGHFAQLSV